MLTLSLCGVGWGGAESLYCQTQPCVEVRLGFWQHGTPSRNSKILFENCTSFLWTPLKNCVLLLPQHWVFTSTLTSQFVNTSNNQSIIWVFYFAWITWFPGLITSYLVSSSSLLASYHTPLNFMKIRAFIAEIFQNNTDVCLILHFKCILHILKIWASKFHPTFKNMRNSFDILETQHQNV